MKRVLVLSVLAVLWAAPAVAAAAILDGGMVKNVPYRSYVVNAVREPNSGSFAAEDSSRVADGLRLTVGASPSSPSSPSALASGGAAAAGPRSIGGANLSPCSAAEDTSRCLPLDLR